MKHIAIVFLFITTNAFSQFYSTIKENTHPDKAHKDKPAYIEIDTNVIKDLDQVIIYYNSELIKREGNRFYLSSKPFQEGKSTSLSTDLTEKGKKDLAEYEAAHKPKGYTTAEFNKLHEQDFYKMSGPDTLSMGSIYEAFLEIDPAKVKDPDKLTVLFCGHVPLTRTENKFKIAYKPLFDGYNDYDISIITKEKKRADTIKFTRTFFVKLPAKPATAKKTDYVMIPQVAPVFNSKDYSSFNDYFIQSVRKEKLKLSGKIFLSYTAMTDGSTRFEEVMRGAVSDEEKVIIKKIVEGYSGWTPGEDNGKKVNVNIMQPYNFK